SGINTVDPPVAIDNLRSSSVLTILTFGCNTCVLTINPPVAIDNLRSSSVLTIFSINSVIYNYTTNIISVFVFKSNLLTFSSSNRIGVVRSLNISNRLTVFTFGCNTCVLTINPPVAIDNLRSSSVLTILTFGCNTCVISINPPVAIDNLRSSSVLTILTFGCNTCVLTINPPVAIDNLRSSSVLTIFSINSVIYNYTTNI